MSAETLRKAASEMREYGARGLAHGPEWDGDYAADGGWLPPAVALAVAEWIDGHGRDLESSGGHLPSCDSPGDVQQALSVARAYLGESA